MVLDGVETQNLRKMTILVEWKWQPNQTYLVIFHFVDMFTKTNLRGKLIKLPQIKYEGNLHSNGFVNVLMEKNPELKPYITWAPSHPEVARMAEVLLFANIINGLNKSKRILLRDKLQEPRLRPKFEINIEQIKQIKGDYIMTKDGILWELTEGYIEFLRAIVSSIKIEG